MAHRINAGPNTRAFAFRAQGPEPLPPKTLPLTLEVDGVRWTRTIMADGVACVSATCPCGAHLTTEGRMVKPAAVQCRRCKVWRRLP